jgi:outer membrane protein assembly factor BamE (lipoprotein component of BamABCDE complex)
LNLRRTARFGDQVSSAASIILHRTDMRLFSARFLCLLLLATASSGCVYRMDIQQGNYLEGKTVDRLEVGMTRSQVRYLLGTPLVPDLFDKDRWDYYYYFEKGHRRPQQRHLVVYFKEDKVAHFDRINVPNSAPQAPDQGPTPEQFPRI